MTDYKCAWTYTGPDSKKFIFQYFGWEPVEAIVVDHGQYEIAIDLQTVSKYHLLEMRDALKEDCVKYPQCREIYSEISHELDERNNKAYKKPEYKIPHWRCINNEWVCMEDED